MEAGYGPELKAPYGIGIRRCRRRIPRGLAACNSGSSDPTSTGGSRQDTKDYSKWCDLKSELQGKSVSIYTSIVAPEDAQHKASYKAFEECTGVTIKYEGDKDFEKNLPASAPRPATCPTSPTSRSRVCSRPWSTPARPSRPPRAWPTMVDKNFGADWKKYGTVDDTFYAAPLGANVKSYVWYSPKKFTEKGYKPFPRPGTSS
jgi:alpha-glucoside transport system substrate-binding protein